MGKLKRKEKHEAELSQLEKDIESQRHCFSFTSKRKKEWECNLETLRRSSARGASTSIQHLDGMKAS